MKTILLSALLANFIYKKCFKNQFVFDMTKIEKP